MQEILFICLVLIIGFIIKISINNYTRRNNQFDILNGSRTKKDLDDFYTHFLNLGYPEKWIDVVLEVLRNHSLATKTFIPNTKDSFTKDYLWSVTLADQYSSFQMRLAGLVLREIAMISISESDWHLFQEKNGPIDNFDDLFKYLDFKISSKTNF